MAYKKNGICYKDLKKWFDGVKKLMRTVSIRDLNINFYEIREVNLSDCKIFALTSTYFIYDECTYDDLIIISLVLSLGQK